MYMSYTGGVTGSGANLFFTMVLPKSINGLTPTLNRFNCESRGPSGYLSGTGAGYSDLPTLGSVSYYATDNTVTFRIVKTTGTWNTNNTVATLSANEVDISFS